MSYPDRASGDQGQEHKMSTFQITSSGNLIGEYEADTKEEALQAMIEDAGYESMENLCDAGASDPEDFEIYEL
jgi:hypothetical protein